LVAAVPIYAVPVQDSFESRSDIAAVPWLCEVFLFSSPRTPLWAHQNHVKCIFISQNQCYWQIL